MASSAGKRLVHQQDIRLNRQGPRQRHALPLAAGELVGESRGEIGQADKGQRGQRAAVALGPGEAELFEPQTHIVDHTPPGQKPGILEDKRQGRTVGGGGRDGDRSAAWPGKADQYAQQCRLPNAGGPDDGEELAAPDRQVQIVEHAGLLAIALEGERQAADIDHAFHCNSRPCRATKTVSSRP